MSTEDEVTTILEMNNNDSNRLCLFSSPTPPWKKLSMVVYDRMHKMLPILVKTKKRLNGSTDTDICVDVQSSEMNMTLKKVFPNQKEVRRKPVCWWNEEIQAAHVALKKARRRKRRYGYDNMRVEFNECRRRFRYLVKQAKIASWQKFTSLLIKIIQVTDVSRSLCQILSAMFGTTAPNLTCTLVLLGKKFYPAPEPLSYEHLVVEKSVKDKLLNMSSSSLIITVCAFHAAFREMSRSTAAAAAGFEKISNPFLQFLATKGRSEKQCMVMFDECLKSLPSFPQVWEMAKMVFKPMPPPLLWNLPPLSQT